MTRRQGKPRELLDLYPEAELLFRILRQEFGVPEIYQLHLQHVDFDRQGHSDLAALTMERSQALRRAAEPGKLTTSDVVIALTVQLAHALNVLATAATSPDSSRTILVIRQKLTLAGQAVVDLDGSPDGAPTELL